MIDDFEKLAAVSLLVQLEKQATVDSAIEGVGKGIKDAGRAVYRGIGAATGGAAQHLKQFGVGGRLAGGAIRLAPWVLGAAAVNEALGRPTQNIMKAKLREFRAKRQQQQAVYDPRTGRMY